MKILLIHNYYQQRGGEDSAFEAECELLERQGHQIERILFENNRIRSPLDRLQAGLQTPFSLAAIRPVLKAIRRFSPDIIHVHNFFPLISPSVFLLAKWMQVPIVATLHNYRLVCANAVLFREQQSCTVCTDKVFPWEGIRYGCYQNSSLKTASLVLMSALHKWIGTFQRCVDRFIVLSEYEKNFLTHSSLKLNPQHLAVKPNFTFPLQEQSNPKSEASYFVFVGRLSVEKGIHPLLEAFEGTNLPLKIIGTGPLEALVKAACSRSPNIEFLGFQERAVACQQMKNAIALVFPSVLPETFGLSIIEAFSVGTPAIIYPIGGPSELVRDGINGLYAETASAQSLREVAEKLWNDDSLQTSLAQQAYRSYTENYTPEKNYEQLMAIYQSVLRTKKHA